jgi:8-oxo-dGTP diphosphatase
MRVRKRPSARLLVLDGQGRVLLFRFSHSDGALAGKTYWATPGGGLDEGESFADAARRELLEETGIDQIPGPEIAIRNVQFMLPDGDIADADERYFLVRTDSAIDIANNPDPVERAFIAEMRWWSVAELGGSAETIYPENIAEMIAGADVR